MEVKDTNISQFSIEYLKTINMLHTFFQSIKDWKIEEYIEPCENLIRCFRNDGECLMMM